MENAFEIRKYEPNDAIECGRCFFEGFFDCALTDEDRRFLTAYAQVLIEKCSFCYVAVKDGEVVGFVSGSYRKRFDKKLAKCCDTKRHYRDWLACFVKFYMGGYKLSDEFRRQFDAFFRRVRERDRSTPVECDCELVALSSKKQFRKGLGTALWQAFAARCRADGAKRVRLFTDSDASYRFYEKRGFSRVWEKPYSFASEGAAFVYEYLL